jgi:DNA ligase 1
MQNTYISIYYLLYMEYSEIVELYEKLTSSTKRLDKTYYISEFLKLANHDLDIIFLLLRGHVYPDWDETKIGFAAKMAIKAIVLSSGLKHEQIMILWKKLGDLGDVAEFAISKKKQSTLFTHKLTLAKVFSNLRKLSSQDGLGSVDTKIKLVSELLTSASPKEAKYIIRMVLEDMRVGIGDSTLRDSIAWSCFDLVSVNLKEKDYVKRYLIKDRDLYNNIIIELQNAYDIANEWSIVFEKAKIGISELKKIKLHVGKPIKVMLYPKAVDYKDAFERLGKPCAFEYKYDGFRMQIHKDNEKVNIFTRRLDNVTEQFPEIRDVVLKNIKADSCIIDCEAVGFDSSTGIYLPFQNISQRIKRKHGISEMLKKLPVELNIFDIILYNGESQLNVPFEKRRSLLNNIVSQESKKIVLAHQLITSSIDEAKDFFDKAIKSGNEGLMAKKLDGIYKPGARVGYGMKIKSMLEPLDLVIVKAEYGEGKRAGWLSSFTLACIDDDGSILEIGKVSTGLKEKEEQGVSFIELTNLLKPLILSENDKEVEVKPHIVIEVGYEEIQKSTSYSSGYALRFPRFLRLRDDKHLSEITSIDYIDKLYRDGK